MTTPDPDAARDLRRASALIGHHARHDAEGLSGVLAEVAGVEELIRLLVAVLTVHKANLDASGLPLDPEALDRLTLSLATAEGAS